MFMDWNPFRRPSTEGTLKTGSCINFNCSLELLSVSAMKLSNQQYKLFTVFLQCFDRRLVGLKEGHRVLWGSNLE